eukprot:g3451.t1
MQNARSKPPRRPKHVHLGRVSVEDVSSGSSGAHVLKWKAKEEGTALVKLLQHYTVVEGEEETEVEKVETFDFTVKVVPPAGSSKADWYAWSWYDVKWVKAPANKADKFAKKMGKAAMESPTPATQRRATRPAPARIAYGCKTCGLSSASCICVFCFDAGDHEGHDFYISRSDYGCCDCGDAYAWRPSGFCRHHPGPRPEIAPWTPTERERHVRA